MTAQEAAAKLPPEGPFVPEGTEPVVLTMDNEAYHAAPGVSRSALWTVWEDTPAHHKFAPERESSAQKLGSAAHCAVLEPEAFESRYEKGPDARANSNAWKHAEADASERGLVLLKPGDYDAAQLIRESAHSLSSLRRLLKGARVEQAAFARDEETGLLVKCKPDIYNPDLQMIADVKTAANAGMIAFSRSIGTYGYHVQEAFYTDIWNAAASVQAFVFIVIESRPPYLTAQYELPPSAAREGRAVYREALNIYAECEREDRWPGFPDEVKPIDLRPWDYQLTRPGE